MQFGSSSMQQSILLLCRDSSVGIATCWTVRRSNTSWWPDVPHPSRPALRLTQTPV